MQSPVSLSLSITKDDAVFAREAKLHNRRVGLVRDAQGNAILIYRVLRGWKQIEVQRVGLSPEAAAATMHLLIASQRSSKQTRVL